MLATLAADDPDHAGDQNGVGFSGAHVRQGHRLANATRWNAAMATDAWQIARHYRHTQLAGCDWQAAEEEARAAFSARDARCEPPGDPNYETGPEYESEEPTVDYPKLHPETSVLRLLGPGGPIARSLPGYAARAPQIAMAETIVNAFAAGQHAVIEAGTGTGKGFAYLAALLASGQSAIISTAGKSLQDQLANDDLPFLQQHCGIPFTFAVLKGRSNYLCRDRVQEIQDQVTRGGAPFKTTDVAAAWPALIAWLSQTTNGDLDAPTPPLSIPKDLREQVTVSSDECHGQDCPSYESCFAQQAKARAQAARFVVVNHTLLLLDSMIRDSTAGQVALLPSPAVVVIDECHRLPEVASDVFGHSVTERALARLSAPLQRLTVNYAGAFPVEAQIWLTDYRAITQCLHAAMDQLAARLDRKRDQDGAGDQRAQATDSTLPLGDERPLLAPVIAQLVALAARMEEEIPDWLEARQERTKWGKLARLLVRHAAALRVIATPADGQVARFMRRADNGALELCANPIDVTEQLRTALWWRNNPQTDSALLTVSTSATIAAGGSLDYWCARVGLVTPTTAILPSPFDYPRTTLLYIPPDGQAFDSSLARGNRNGSATSYHERMAAEIDALVTAAGGGTLLLFTSWTMLKEMAARISDWWPYTVLVQGQAQPDELIRRFKADGNAVLFGLRRFWEGISIDGPALRLVVIDKLPFPTPSDPVYAARCRALEQTTGDQWAGFNQIGLPEATIMLKQGAGRLIRRESDYGVVAILDGRLRTKRYSGQVIADLPPFRRTHTRQDVAAFFRTRGYGTTGEW